MKHSTTDCKQALTQWFQSLDEDMYSEKPLPTYTGDDFKRVRKFKSTKDGLIIREFFKKDNVPFVYDDERNPQYSTFFVKEESDGSLKVYRYNPDTQFSFKFDVADSDPDFDPNNEENVFFLQWDYTLLKHECDQCSSWLYLLPEEYDETSESYYQPPEGTSRSEVRKFLTSLGLVEERSSGDTGFYDDEGNYFANGEERLNYLQGMVADHFNKDLLKPYTKTLTDKNKPYFVEYYHSANCDSETCNCNKFLVIKASNDAVLATFYLKSDAERLVNELLNKG